MCCSCAFGRCEQGRCRDCLHNDRSPAILMFGVGKVRWIKTATQVVIGLGGCTHDVCKNLSSALTARQGAKGRGKSVCDCALDKESAVRTPAPERWRRDMPPVICPSLNSRHEKRPPQLPQLLELNKRRYEGRMMQEERDQSEP